MRSTRIIEIDKPISVIGLGTMVFHPDTRDRDHRLLDAFVEQGGTFIDTAEIYGAVEEHGLSELVIGEWLSERQGIRDSIVLASKGLIPGSCASLHEGGAVISPKSIRSAIEGSLRRLQTDYLDVWMFHRDDEALSVGPLVEALNAEIEAGRIRTYGASNWSTARIQEAIEYATMNNLHRMSVASPQYSLAKPNEPYWPNTIVTTERDEKWFAEQCDLLVVAWSSLGRGFFAKGDADVKTDADLVRVFYNDANFERKARATSLAKVRGISMFEVALAYVTNQGFPVVALVGSVTSDEVLTSTAAGDITLSESERAWLNLETDEVPF